MGLVVSLKDAWIGLRSHTQGWPQGSQNDQSASSKRAGPQIHTKWQTAMAHGLP
ncbi:hypothetical protein I79_008078 [Cricetulus griseus]|uniref:Uncharacterized protein n=1 Tax=Cricetulus griseus TaxID=10029 RepID=G3HC74_CRIGR|nr:hypothetical protein I79_008078 [Cricetulus griseus]